MKAFLLLPNDDNENYVKSYIIEKKVLIDENNILTIQEFGSNPTYPSLLFLVAYDSMSKIHVKIAVENKRAGGFNVSIKGDEQFYKIDKYLDSADANEMNLLLSRFSNSSFDLEEKKIQKNNINRGKLLSIMSSKGGVGKSFLTFNLGYILSKINKKDKRILLVDYNLSEGSLSRYFWEFWQHSNRIDTIVEYFSNFNNIDKDYLQDIIVKNPKLNLTGEVLEGIDILFAPDNFSIIPKKINSNYNFTDSLFKVLRENYDVIIADTSNEKNIYVNDYLIRHSDKVALVTSPNPNSIIQIKEYIEEVGLEKSKYDVIYNDYNSIVESFDLEKVISSLFSLNIDEKNYRKSIEHILENKLFIIETHIGIKKADHNWDSIFNTSRKYIPLEELDKYRKIFYKIIESNFSIEIFEEIFPKKPFLKKLKEKLKWK